MGVKEGSKSAKLFHGLWTDCNRINAFQFDMRDCETVDATNPSVFLSASVSSAHVDEVYYLVGPT